MEGVCLGGGGVGMGVGGYREVAGGRGGWGGGDSDSRGNEVGTRKRSFSIKSRYIYNPNT